MGCARVEASGDGEGTPSLCAPYKISRDSVWDEGVRKAGAAQENLRIKLKTLQSRFRDSQTDGALCADQEAGERGPGVLSIWKNGNQWHTTYWRPHPD